MSSPGPSLRIALIDAPDLATVGAELRGAGLSWTSVPPGAAAIPAVAALGVDVVVLDHDLADGTGPTMLEGAAAALPGVKIVVLSNATTARSAVRIFRQGATDVVLKPLAPGDLALALARFRTDLPPPAPVPEAPAAPSPTPRGAHGLSRPAWASPIPDGGPLPPLHPRLAEIQAATTRLDAGVSDVIRIAEADQALASRVLQTANTAWYRGPRAYTNIKDACVRLGNRETLGIFMETAYAESFKGVHPALRGIVDRFRRTTVLGARISRVLATEANINKVEELYAATLLQNNGELILLWRLGASLAPNEQLGGDRIDEATFFIDQLHEEAGATFARAKTLPPLTVALAQHHHSSRLGEVAYDRTLRLIVLASWAKARQAVGAYLPSHHPADPAAFYAELNVGPAVQNKIDVLVRNALSEDG